MQARLVQRCNYSENAKIAFAHINYDENENMEQERKQSVIAGQYTVGGMTMYLGFGQTRFRKWNGRRCHHSCRTKRQNDLLWRSRRSW